MCFLVKIKNSYNELKFRFESFTEAATFLREALLSEDGEYEYSIKKLEDEEC